MYKLAVFISGRGSNLNSIIEYFNNFSNIAEVSLVISNKINVYGLEIAKNNNIKTLVLYSKENILGLTFEQLSDILIQENIDLIVLAGFLKKIPDSFIDKFENKIINIHPALLPSFGGAGMYGMNVHNAVFEKSAQVSGVTIHFVNKVYDEGMIIAQKCVDIKNVKSAEEIASRVLKIEHELLPFVIHKFASNKIKILNNRVYIEE